MWYLQPWPLAGLVALWAIACATCLADDAGPPPTIALTVSDRLGLRREGEPVCSGVPFARGALQRGQPMHVQTEDGKPLPTQTQELGHWPDGSVKWLLVQFRAHCPADESRTYRLAPGDSPAPEQPLAVSDEKGQVVIDTGPLRATVPTSDLVVLGDVWLRTDDGEVQVLTGGTPMTFVLADGATHTSKGVAPESVAVTEAGPVRATVRVVGWLAGPDDERRYKLDARLRFYGGETRVQAEYTFICLGQPELHQVREISVDLMPPVADAARFVLPGAERTAGGQLATGQMAVVAVDQQMVGHVGLVEDPREREASVEGWAILGGGRALLGAAVRDFRHLCPKAIEVSPGHLKLALWSSRVGDILNLGRTRSKTHHVLYDFSPNSGDNAALLARLRGFQEPLIATTAPEYFCSTDALGSLSPEGPPETAEYDRKMRECFEPLREARENQPLENGLLHYGDYHHGGYGNAATRGDLEYDTGHGCYLLYVRSGDRDYYEFALACNQHFIDIDVNQETGEQRFHGYGERAETHEAVTTGLEWGHIFVDCAADTYLLTGDERSLEAVRMIADCVARIAEGEGHGRIRAVFAGAERQLGWPLLALCRAYEVTRDDKYLQAATKIVDYVKRYAADPIAAYEEGKWWRCWMMDGCKLFMTGELHNGLSKYYEITGDPEMRAAIVTSLDWLIDHMWNPDVNGFVYEFNAMNRGHRRAGITSLNMLGVDAFRFGYEITGDRRYLSVAVRTFAGWLRDAKPSDARQFSQDARTSPHTAAYLHRERLSLDDLPPAPQPLRPEKTEPPPGPREELLLRATFEGNLNCETPHGTSEGEAVGDVRFEPGRHGQGVAVGQGGYAVLPAPPEMLRGPGTIELWLKLPVKVSSTNPGQRAVFHVEGDTPLIDSLALCTIYNELRVRMKDHIGHLNGTAEGDIGRWNAGDWRHVVITWDENRVRLYLDGQEQMRGDEGSHPGDGVETLPGGEQTKLNLGWRFGNWLCDCVIDELTIFGRALSAEEIASRATQ